MKKHLLVFFIGLLSIMTSLRVSAQTFDWSCFPTSGTILADNNGIANLNLTTANCSVANGWVLQCQGTGEQRILSSAIGGNPYIRMQKVGTDATFSFARILTASGALFTLKSISVTPTSVGAAAGGNQVITLHAFKGGREQGSTQTGSLSSITLVNIPESQLGAFVNIDEIRFTSDQSAAFGVGIDDVVIVAAPTVPVVTTDASSTITASSATLTGTVTADGGATVTEKGIVYGTTPNPNIVTGTKLTNGSGTGAISANATGLASGTRYYFRAYATNTRGTGYGTNLFFNTLANTAPVAVADNYNFNTGTALTVAAPGVLGNDTDADGDPLTAILVSGPVNGTLALNPNGSFTYTPTGITNDQFTYKVNDGKVDGNTVTVTLTHINAAPVVTASAGTTVFSGSDAVVDPGITVSDDGGTLASGVISITGGLHSAEDQLVFTPNGATGDINGSYNRLVGVLSLQSSSGAATIAQWQAALRAVVYRNQQVPPTANVRTITFSVNDGTLDSNPASKAVSIALSAISTSGTLSALNSTYGTASASGTFNVSGVNLAAGILVTAPTGFEVSMDNTTFAPTITIGSAGTIPSTPVYIRLAASTNAGNYSGNAVLSSSGASSLNVPTVASTVSPKKLTITAKNITKTYGQALTGGATTTEFTTAGLVGTETIGNVTLAYGTGAAANAAVNTYTGTITASAANGGTFNPANYTINYIAGNIIVNKAALTITANNKGKAFGTALTGGTGSVDFTSTGLANAETIGSVTITYGASAAANAPVGPYAGSIVPSAATGGTFNIANYNITYTAGTLTVGQAILTITANSTIKTYGSPVPTLTVSYSGFVGTDNASSLTTLPTISTPAVTNSPVNTYPITVSGAVSSNYTIVYQPGTITVTPAPLTVTASSTTKTYGSANPVFAATYTGFVGTDNAASLTKTPTVTTTALINSPVNTYPITASGAVSPNYTFIYQPGTLTVTPSALTITASNATKTYGSANPALDITYTGFVGTDNAASLTVAPTVNTTAVNNSPVGTYPVTASGAVSANYAIVYTSGTLSVTKAALTITANNKGKAFGTALTGGPGSVDFTSTGLANAETIGSVTITYGAGAAANAPAGSYAGSIVPSVATGGTFSAANYTITYKAGTLSVGQAILTITANSTIKTYGSPIPTLTVSYSGFVGTDNASSLTTLPTISTPTVINSPVGTYAITPSGAVSSNYTIVYQPGTLSVTPAPLTVTASNQNKVYGQNLTGGAGSTAFTSTGLVGSETIGSVTITYGTGAVAGAPVNTYIGAIVPGSATGGTFNAANYNISYAAGNITVGKAPITVTANAGSKIYGNVDPTLTYAVTTGALVGTDTFTGVLTRAPGENAGTYVILQGTLALNNNYTLTYAGANFTINKAAITLTADPQTKPYGSVDPALTFKITNGGLKFADTFTGTLTRAPGENAGIYPILQGSLAISSNYALTYAGANLTIGKADITVTADVQSKAFGAADPALTFKITSGGLKFADTFTGALTRVAGENAGTYAIQQGTLALSSNYNLTYVGANLSIGKTAITVTADVQTKTYGNVDPVLTYKITSGVLGSGDKFTGTLTRVPGENAGTYAIQQGSLTLGSNYTLTYISANLTVGKAAITLTADAQTKAYGAADPALTFKITTGALKFADTFTGKLTRANGENAGTYAIQQGTLALSSNYNLTYAGANLTISKADITVTANAQNKVYGNVDPALTYAVTAGALVGADKFTGSLTRVAGENAGTYTIQQGTLALNSNYTLTYVGANLTIGKAAITITADAQIKAYGSADPTLSYKITGGALVGADIFTGTLTRVAGENAGTYAIKQGTLALNSNYTLTYLGANLTIGKVAITVTADAQTKAYGDVDPALTFKVTSGTLKFADTFTGKLSRAAGENAGTYAIQQGTLALSNNYTLTYADANLTIGKAAITVTADAQSKAFGAADLTLTYKVTNGALKFADTFTGTLTRAPGENAGTYAIQQGTLALSSNYTLTYVGANFTIDKAVITVTADVQTKVYGATDPTLTYKITSGTLVGTDKFTGTLTRVTGENVGTYAVQQGTLALSSNYTLTYVGANLTIGKAAIMVTADVQTKVYGATDPTLTYKATNGVLVGTDKFTGALTRTAGEDAGTYAIQQGTLALNSNYNLTYASANLTIDKAAIIVTADAQSKFYGATDPALTYQITSGALVGTDKFTGALSRVAGENAGSYPVQQGTLALSSNYTLTYVGANLTIGKAAITVTADDQTKIYGTADPALTYKITNGALVGTDKFTGAPSRVAGENAGSYLIQQGSLVLNANYTLTYVGANLTINKAALTITADAQTKTYGEADPALTYKITHGALIGTDKFTGALTRVTGENVGVYVIQQGTLALNTNYTLTYAGANLTITQKALTITANNATKIYGSANPAFNVSYSGFAGSDNTSSLITQPTVSTVAVANSPVGTYPITANGAVSANYSIVYKAGTLTVTSAALTITANNATKSYGQTLTNQTASTAFTSTGLIGTETIGSVSITYGTGAAAGAGVGTYNSSVVASTATGGTFTPANYHITYLPGNIVVNQLTLIITANNVNKIYGSANPALGVTYSGFVNGDNSNTLTSKPIITTAATQTSGAGNYPVTVSGAVITNYKIVYVVGTLTINKAMLTITTEDKSRLYGVANPVFTAVYNGFVNGDSQTALAKLPLLATIANSTSLPGSYPITVSGAASANYSFNYLSGKLTVIALSNAKLINLVPTSGTLTPSFNSDNFNYRSEVDNEISGVRLTLTFDPTATAHINGSSASNDRQSFNIPLNIGNNTITIVVTAQDHVTTNTYTLVIYRGEDQKNIVASNILTPNGDGKNDTWVIADIQLYPNNTVTVFDKGGRTVYNKHGYTNDWNGSFGGAPLTEGTYYYVIDLGPQQRKFKGFITIIHDR